MTKTEDTTDVESMLKSARRLLEAVGNERDGQEMERWIATSISHMLVVGAAICERLESIDEELSRIRSSIAGG